MLHSTPHFRPGLLLTAAPAGSALRTQSGLQLISLPFPVLAQALHAADLGHRAPFVEALMRRGFGRAPASHLWRNVFGSELVRTGEPARWLRVGAIHRLLPREYRGRPMALAVGRPSRSEVPDAFLVAVTARGVFAGPLGAGCANCLALWITSQTVPILGQVPKTPQRGSALVTWPIGFEQRLRALLSQWEVRPSEARRTLWVPWSGRSFRVRLRPHAGCRSCGALAISQPSNAGRARARLVPGALRRLGYAYWESASDDVARTTFALPCQCKEEGRWTLKAIGLDSMASGRSRALSVLRARAEAVERACWFLRRPDVTQRSFREMPGSKPPLESLQWYSAAQTRLPGFPFPRLTANTRVDWARAVDLESGAQTHVPLQSFWSEGREFQQRVGSGVAAHVEPEQALIHAVLEAIERDALTRAWYCGPPPWVYRGRQDAETARLLGELKRRGWRVHLRWVSTHDLFAAFAVATLHERRGVLVPGAAIMTAGAGFSLEMAIEKAVRELRGLGRVVLGQLADGKTPTPTLSEMRRAPDVGSHLLLYLDQRFLPAIHWFLSGSDRPAPPPRPPFSLRGLVKRLAADGLRVLAVDLSVPALAPWVAYEVVVLGALPLTFGYDCLPMGLGLLPGDTPRPALTFPNKGFALAPGALNPYPLPFG